MRSYGSGDLDHGKGRRTAGVDRGRFSRVGRVALGASLIGLLVACEMSVGPLAGRASETWTHTYPLVAGGESGHCQQQRPDRA